MTRRMRILIAEEDENFIDLIAASLKVAGGYYDLEVVSSGEACLKKLREDRFDILILDHSLADGNGLNWLKRFHELGIEVPTVFVTATGDPQMSIQAMQAGVFDYINRSAECAKAVPFVLNRVVEGYNLMTQKVKLQKELIEAKNFLESIIGNAGDAIMVVDLAQKVIYWNRGAERIFGYPAAEILGRPILELVMSSEAASKSQEEKRLSELIAQVRQQDMLADTQVRWQTKDEREVVTSTTITNLNDASGKMIGTSLICKDITEQKKTEEKMFLAERLSSMGEMMAGVAHEIRNPLAGIKINTQILARRADASDMERQLLESSLEGIAKIQKIVEDMLDYARPKAAEYKEEDINSVVDKSLDVLNSQLMKAGIVTSFTRGEGLPPVRIDKHQIQQVLVNILLNAIQAMEGAAEKRLTLRTFLISNSSLGLEVADTGLGIPPKYLKKIFDPFFTTKSRGTGLGLSITHKLLENHGAKIQVTSEEGRGTRFTIEFPVGGG